MQLIDRKWNSMQSKWEYTYLANSESDVTVPDDDAAIGSQILVIGSGAMYIKNTEGEWQKNGTDEVIG